MDCSWHAHIHVFGHCVGCVFLVAYTKCSNWRPPPSNISRRVCENRTKQNWRARWHPDRSIRHPHQQCYYLQYFPTTPPHPTFPYVNFFASYGSFTSLLWWRSQCPYLRHTFHWSLTIRTFYLYLVGFLLPITLVLSGEDRCAMSANLAWNSFDLSVLVVVLSHCFPTYTTHW